MMLSFFKLNTSTGTGLSVFDLTPPLEPSKTVSSMFFSCTESFFCAFDNVGIPNPVITNNPNNCCFLFIF